MENDPKRNTAPDGKLDPALLLTSSGEGPGRPGEPFGPELELWADGIEQVIGTDEAGRGPLAGPVVAAAVAFAPDARLEGITDSKLLVEQVREELYSQITSTALAWAVVERDHKRIDEINILQATREAMDEAVRLVAEQLAWEWPTVLVDGIIPRLGLGNHINLPKGDLRSFSIGAASILAKVHRDRLMVELDVAHPGYGFAENRGYFTKAHIEALLELGPCPVHRLSFALNGGKKGSDAPRIPIGDLKPGLTRRDLARMAAARKGALTRRKRREELERLRRTGLEPPGEEP